MIESLSAASAPVSAGPPLVDGVDEGDHDAMEDALGAALTAILLAWLLPGPSSFFGVGKATWSGQLEARLGLTLSNFIQRSASDLASASDIAGASVAAAEASAETYTRVMGALERWSEVTMHHLAKSAPDGEQPPAATIQTAAENLARSIANYAKNDARDETAGRLGAVWSIWKTRHDDRVRRTHEGLDYAQVPFGGRFVTDTGAMLRFPGDPEAPLEETMGCRCHLAYRLKPKSASYSDV